MKKLLCVLLLLLAFASEAAAQKRKKATVAPEKPWWIERVGTFSTGARKYDFLATLSLTYEGGFWHATYQASTWVTKKGGKKFQEVVQPEIHFNPSTKEGWFQMPIGDYTFRYDSAKGFIPLMPDQKFKLTLR